MSSFFFPFNKIAIDINQLIKSFFFFFIIFVMIKNFKSPAYFYQGDNFTPVDQAYLENPYNRLLPYTYWGPSKPIPIPRPKTPPPDQLGVGGGPRCYFFFSFLSLFLRLLFFFVLTAQIFEMIQEFISDFLCVQIFNGLRQGIHFPLAPDWQFSD